MKEYKTTKDLGDYGEELAIKFLENKRLYYNN